MILRSTHIIGFYGEMGKIICQLSSNKHIHSHQSSSFITYINGAKLSGSCFYFLLEIGQCYAIRQSLNFWTLVLFYKGYYVGQYKMFCCGEKGIFVNCNTDSKINLCYRALFLRYVAGQNRGYRIALSDFKKWLLTRKKLQFY